MLGVPMATNAFFQPDRCISEKKDACGSPPCKRLKQASFECIIIDDDINDVESSSQSLANSDPTNKLINQYEGEKQLDSNDEQNVEQSFGSEDQRRSNLMEVDDQSEDLVQEQNEPPLPFNGVLPESGEPSNLSIGLPNSNKYDVLSTKKVTASSHSPKVTKESGTMLSFFQPVTPGGGKTTVEKFETPLDMDSGETCRGVVAESPHTPVDGKSSPGTSEGERVSPASTKCSGSKTITPGRKTPGRKLSVEEKLKREEERLRKQKEKDALEQQRLEKKKEKERLKEEKQKERMEERRKKAQEKLDQQELKKQREKERIEKKEMEEKEKKEKMERKEEEKRKKEEERKKKEDEKTLKNEEKRKREEEQALKKQKAKNSFASFFIKKEVAIVQKPKEQVPKEAKFQPFELKPFMKLSSAPFRKALSENARQQLSKLIEEQAFASNLCLAKEEFLALRELAREMKTAENQNKTESSPEKNEEDIMIIDNDVATGVQTMSSKHSRIKGKLLQFHANYRPAYFGTWRKKSASVGPRTPFKKDEELMDYDVDSDDEWEEEEPGESLSNSEGEDEDGNPTDDEDEQDGFFVPHGYLSDDEGDGEEAMEHDGSDGQNPSQCNTENKMERHLAKQKTWEAEMKRQFKPMKAIAIGCIWDDGEIPTILKQLEACCLVSEGSIDPTHVVKKDHYEPTTPTSSSSTYCNTAMPVPEEAMPFLIRMLHGSTAGLRKAVRIFRKRWTLETKRETVGISEENWEQYCTVSKRQVERKIPSIAVKEVRAALPKPRWYVHSNILAQYELENLALPMNGLVTTNSKEKSTSPLPVPGKSPAIALFTTSSQSHSQSKTASRTMTSFTKSNEKQDNAVTVHKTLDENKGAIVMDSTPQVITLE